ncbi:MAG: hypothetical protein M3Y87_21025 [Myxococcota bacterium]|nr:hypothetical protein [Myxococcota bacterium]
MRSVVVLTVLVVFAACDSSTRADVRAGDLVFHRSSSAQSRVIAEVTGSELTHVGVVLARDGTLEVLEAGSPVGWTPLDEWIARGEGGRFEVRRLREPPSEEQLAALRREGERLVGRPYDARFGWGDQRLYCSELVYLVFERAIGVQLVTPQRWRDLPLGASARRLAERRLGRLPSPAARVVTPVALAESALAIAAPR